jgi:hypothetical protein
MKCKCICHEGGKEKDNYSKLSNNSNSNKPFNNNFVPNNTTNSSNSNQNIIPTNINNNINKNNNNSNNSTLLNNNIVHPNVTINKSASIIKDNDSIGSKQKKPSILKKTNVYLYLLIFIL